MTRLSLSAVRAADRLSRRRQPRARVAQFTPPPIPRQPPPEPDLEPEEERSLLGSIIGGVQYVGEMFDKPGSAVRGLLAGEPGQLLNLLPFSDTIGLTDPEDRVSGRDLLEKAGVLRRNRPGLDWGDAAGFAAEIALDPLTWLVGPLYKGAKAAGKGAKAATGSTDELAEGIDIFKAATQAAPGEISAAARKVRTPATYAEQIRQGEQPILALKVPFAKEPFAKLTFGENTKASNAAARALESMFYGGSLNPIVGARSLFSHTAGEAYTGAAQRLKDIKYAEMRAMDNQILDITPSFLAASKVLQRKYQELAEVAGGSGDQVAFNQFTRAMIEAGKEIPKADEMMNIMTRTMGLEDNALQAVENVDEISRSFDTFLNGLRDTQNIAYARVRALGMRGEDLNDIFIPHYGRRGTANLDDFKMALGRNTIWRHMPGGAETINDFSMDPLLTGTFEQPIITLTEVQAKAAKGLAPGTIVRAADRGNYGKVLSVQGDNALVFFTSPQGATARVKIPVKKLKAKYYGAPKELMEETTNYAKTPAGQMSKLLREDLKKSGQTVPKNASLKDLRMQYFKMRYTEKLNRVWQNADELRPVRWTNEADEIAEELTRDQFLERTFAIPAVVKLGVGAVKTDVGPSRAEAILSYFGRHGPEITAGGLYDRRVVDDWFSYMSSLAETESTLRSTHRYLGQLATAATPAIRFASDDDSGMISLSKVWADAGFHQRGLKSFVGQHEALAKGITDKKGMADAIGRLVIDEDAAEALKAFKEITSPKTQNAILQMYDKVTGTYKSALTLPWPSFHSRNLLSGQWQAATDGQANLLEISRGAVAAEMHLRGVKTLEFGEEGIQIGVLGRGKGQIADIAGEEAARNLGQMPGKGILSAFFAPGAKEIAKNPVGSIMRFGEDLYKRVEFINRLGYYNVLRKKGYSPSEALYWVKRSQFDYSELSKFEKNVARRATLFWTFSRKNIPYQLTKLAERPGGAAAQTYRLFNQQDPDEYTPSWLREGMSFRTGGTDQEASFFKQSGIPIEDLNLAVFRRGVPTGRTLEKAAARLHPLLTLPIEAFAGKQLFTGRKIKNLRSSTEALTGAFGVPTPMPALDRAVHYSPISRAVSEAMGVIDPRKTPLQKALNALTGFKTSTYDVEKLRLIDLQNALKEQIAASPYTREGIYSYIPERYKQEAAAAGPQEQIRLQRALAKAVKQLQAQRDGGR